jgi:Type IIA topoisomerase (DNA gyrase/topo II, topoisomerase IV), A subunit
MGRAGIREAYHTGRGSIAMRGRATIEEIRKDREAIVITEIPYQVNKARMIERMAETVREKIIEGISDLRDESDRDGVRVVVELKREAMGEVVLNQLYRFTPLQTSFGVNMLALNGGKPMLDEPEGGHRRLHRLPRAGHRAPRDLRSGQDARARPCPWSGSPSPWPISTRSSRSSAAPPIPTPRAKG